MSVNDGPRSSSVTPWLIVAGGLLAFFCLCSGPLVSLVRLALFPFGFDFYAIEARQKTMQLLRDSPEVRQLVGEPIEKGDTFGVTIEDPANTDLIEHQFEVHGPTGTAEVHVQMRYVQWNWELTRLEVIPSGGNGGPIILLDESTRGAHKQP